VHKFLGLQILFGPLNIFWKLLVRSVGLMGSLKQKENGNMTAEKSNNSLIQFCPGVSRVEAVNLGVILLCLGSGFLRVVSSLSAGRTEFRAGVADS